VIWNGFVVGPETAVEGIESLEPGEVRVVDVSGREVHHKRYWQMPRADEREPIGEDELRDALAESVKLHLIADVPLGIFLSGGDELFGGYASFRAIPTMLRWQRRSRMMPSAAKVLAAHVASKVLAPSRGATPAQTRWAKLTDMVRAGDDIVALYQLAYALFLPSFQGRLLLDADLADATQSGLNTRTMERLEREIAGHSPLPSISILEQR